MEWDSQTAGRKSISIESLIKTDLERVQKYIDFTKKSKYGIEDLVMTYTDNTGHEARIAAKRILLYNETSSHVVGIVLSQFPDITMTMIEELAKHAK